MTKNSVFESIGGTILSIYRWIDKRIGLHVGGYDNDNFIVWIVYFLRLCFSAVAVVGCSFSHLFTLSWINIKTASTRAQVVQMNGFDAIHVYFFLYSRLALHWFIFLYELFFSKSFFFLLLFIRPIKINDNNIGHNEFALLFALYALAIDLIVGQKTKNKTKEK